MAPLPKTFLATFVCLGLCADDPTPIDFASLSDFTWVRGMSLPTHVTKLDRVKISITGFMARDGGDTGPVDYFLLINDACGCNGIPFLNEIVFCDMPPGQKTDILPGIVTVEGTLYVGEVVYDDVVTSLYNLDVDKITP